MRLGTLLAVVVFGSVPAACGDDDDSDNARAADESSSAQRCIDSWNAKPNEGHQTSLAGVVSATGLDPEAFRVGTWTGAERTVPVRSPKAAFAESDARAVVSKGNCLVVTPPSHAGEGTFFGDGPSGNSCGVPTGRGFQLTPGVRSQTPKKQPPTRWASSRSSSCFDAHADASRPVLSASRILKV